jgi:hypothetical protein
VVSKFHNQICVGGAGDTPISYTEPDASPPWIWEVRWANYGLKNCGIYVISQQRSAWPVKIGVSADVPRRIAELQTSHWNPLVCYHYWLCEDPKSAFRLERECHAILRRGGHSLLGEWFDLRASHAPKVVQFAAHKLEVEISTTVPDTERYKALRDEWEERLIMRPLLKAQADTDKKVKQRKAAFKSLPAHERLIQPETIY